MTQSKDKVTVTALTHQAQVLIRSCLRLLESNNWWYLLVESNDGERDINRSANNFMRNVSYRTRGMKTHTQDTCTLCFYKNNGYIQQNSANAATNQESACKKLNTNNVNNIKNTK